MSIKSCWWVLLLNFPISLLIFCLVLLIVERRVFQYPYMFVDLSITPFGYVSFCFLYFVVILLGAYTFRTAISSR